MSTNINDATAYVAPTPPAGRPAPLHATVLGTPRIGPNRELKRAIESYWDGRIEEPELHRVAAALRADTWQQLQAAGCDSVPVNSFSYYDHVLDTAVMMGALPSRFTTIDNRLDRYFAAARGTDKIAPLEMTKWFDTNYHYLVPEIDARTTFTLDPSKVLDEIAQAHAADVPARPVILGPITFLALSKGVAHEGEQPVVPLDRINDLLPCYLELLATIADTGVSWVQFDEPALVTDIAPTLGPLANQVYTALAQAIDRPAICVATYFADPGTSTLTALARSGIEGVALDLVEGSVDSVAAVPELAHLQVIAGVVDGRNIWRTDLDHALATLASVLGSVGALAVSTSCSTLHVPYSLHPETELDPDLAGWLAFAAEKYLEVAALAGALRDGRESWAETFASSAAALASRATDPRLYNPELRARLAAVTDADVTRGDAALRHRSQAARLELPALPTTTIGSYPQTAAIRQARAALRSHRITRADYLERMRSEIESVIALQERIGLDVLVHGEPERNDMVQYFAEQLDGFFCSANGWVQSYGTRCVRPPILFGDVSRPHPMTVDWIGYAQSLTTKPVKAMLTGPVTILAWSFVRPDTAASVCADQIALAIRDETVDLEKAGVRIVQVDEPALRELLPLREIDKPRYLTWAVRAFRLATSGVGDHTQIHTHLCYSEFGEVITAIADLDADVTSIEAARSHMEVLDDLNAIGFANAVGPGVYDIHSPRVPEIAEIAQSLAQAVASVGPQRLWVNPDCGLKTRTTAEVTAALTNMVNAAQATRATLN